MTKLLDFWAPWCVDSQTPVLTENGYLPASKIQVGMQLITVDPKTKKQSLKKVRKTRVFKDVPSTRIILETGRNLMGDINHLVLTQEGFKSLDKLSVGEKVLINPAATSVYESVSDAVILETTGNSFADKVLKSLNLLPLRLNDMRLSVLARLLGFVMTDGYLYEDLKHNIYETHFFVGTEEDAQDIKTDLQILGFDKLEIKRQIKNRQIGERKFTISILRCRNFNRAFFFLLKALGSPEGRKKNQAYFVPDWIIDANLRLKREFMSGWLGGDGCKIDYRIRRGGTTSHHAGFSVNAIEFHKEKNLEEEGILYARQLELLLEELGVEVREISSGDDEDGVIIYLRIANNYHSLLNLAKIGYAYAATKNKSVPFIREFLQYRLQERSSYAEVKQTVLQQLALGVSNKLIAEDLQIPLQTVVSWRYTNRDTDIVHPSESGEARFDKWLENRQQGDLLWEKVRLVEGIESRDVIGITVANPHTIVTNGIVSHNCGPCKIMEPVLEELEKELKGKVEIEKINVDENPQKASEYGVMSIPTYVVLKNGKEVARKIGVTAKQELIKLLQS
ncbi:thioredoxin family protein [Candidatus Daviesbacteria bacterium]|nr:thioredoxin family protein [Candidatus Daviesbacteria bacterium]